MTLDELIERLGEYRETLGGNAEVRLMIGSNYPFENAILGVVSGEEINGCDDEDFQDEDVEDDDVLYLVEGDQLCYGSKRAWELGN